MMLERSGVRNVWICGAQNKIGPQKQTDRLAGETRFEHATYGFGDRYSTVEPLP